MSLSNDRGRGEQRRCPYCREVFRNLALHLPACDDVPATEAVIDR